MHQNDHAEILRTRSNRFPGPCHVCRVHVARDTGTAAQTRGQGWLVFCGEHEPGAVRERMKAGGYDPDYAPDRTAFAAATVRPAVSDAAVGTAYALAARAVGDGNADAAALAWELVAAAEYARGGESSTLTAAIDAALAERDRWREIAAKPAGDDLVAEILDRTPALPAVIDVEAREKPEAFIVRDEQPIDTPRPRARRKAPPRAAAPAPASRGTVGEALKGWL